MHYWYTIYGLERAQSGLSYAATLMSDVPTQPLVVRNPVIIPEGRTLDQLAESLVLLGDERALESFYFVSEKEAGSLILPSVRRVVAVSWREQQEFVARYRAYSQQAKKVLV
ncbi:hypothetical protein J4208_04850 [Candidatus Woesearchaeota archaeon]|nr:hypothetical protein [Candidatus Woesearchaeota archaeon]